MGHTHDIHLKFDTEVFAQEVISLRELEYGSQQDEKTWQECINHALTVATARNTDTNELIGIAFVIGNARHAQIVDMVVHPDYRKDGLGGNLLDMCIEFIRERGILFAGLTYDKNHPWLKDFYAEHGFQEIDFALWLEDSLQNLEAR